MLANKSFLVIKKVTERTNSLTRTIKNARKTEGFSLEVTDNTNNFFHKSLELGWLGNIP